MGCTSSSVISSSSHSTFADPKAAGSEPQLQSLSLDALLANVSTGPEGNETLYLSRLLTARQTYPKAWQPAYALSEFYVKHARPKEWAKALQCCAECVLLDQALNGENHDSTKSNRDILSSNHDSQRFSDQGGLASNAIGNQLQTEQRMSTEEKRKLEVWKIEAENGLEEEKESRFGEKRNESGISYELEMTVELGKILHEWNLQSERAVRISLPLQISSQSIINWKFNSQISKENKTIMTIAYGLKESERTYFIELSCLTHVQPTQFVNFPPELVVTVGVNLKHDLTGTLPVTQMLDVQPIEDVALLMGRITDMSELDKHHTRPFANPKASPLLQEDYKFVALMQEVTASVPDLESKVLLSLDYVRCHFRVQLPAPPPGPTISDILAAGLGDSLAYSLIIMCCFRLLKIPAKTLFGIYGPGSDQGKAVVAVWHQKSLQWVIYEPEKRLWGGPIINFIPTISLQDENRCFRDNGGIFCFDFSFLWNMAKKDSVKFRTKK